MTRQSRKRSVRNGAISAEARAAWADMYEGVFFSIMQGMFKATTIEEEYGELHDEIRQRAKDDLHRIARTASEHYVSLANPNPAKASKEQVNAWKREAIEFALRH